MEFLGNLVLLIVGGNDTTRNSISGGVMFLNDNPGEYDKLRSDLSLIPGMVSEIVGEPVRLKSNFVRGIVELPVRLHAL